MHNVTDKPSTCIKSPPVTPERIDGIISVPELRFAWDDTTDRAARLDAVLAEVAADRARESAERAAGAGRSDGGPNDEGSR